MKAKAKATSKKKATSSKKKATTKLFIRGNRNT